MEPDGQGQGKGNCLGTSTVPFHLFNIVVARKISCVRSFSFVLLVTPYRFIPFVASQNEKRVVEVVNSIVRKKKNRGIKRKENRWFQDMVCFFQYVVSI